jgi:hypothetical protein
LSPHKQVLHAILLKHALVKQDGDLVHGERLDVLLISHHIDKEVGDGRGGMLAKLIMPPL